MNSALGKTRSDIMGASDVSAASDEQLLLRYRHRAERRAFDQLVHRYERELYSYLRRYLGSAEAAEDVFQQSFLQVHLKCSQFDERRKFRPWLYTIATHQAIDHQRRNKRHRMVSLDRTGRAPAEDNESGLVDLLAAGEPDPVERSIANERRRRVRRNVDQLPDPLRAVVVLVYFQNLKYREAAEILDIPVGTVKSRMHAAILTLGQAWTESAEIDAKLPR